MVVGMAHAERSLSRPRSSPGKRNLAELLQFEDQGVQLAWPQRTMQRALTSLYLSSNLGPVGNRWPPVRPFFKCHIH